MMRRRYNPYTLPPWLRKCRAICSQLAVPFCLFQGIRTLFFPTTFDVILLAVLILLAVALYLEWI